MLTQTRIQVPDLDRDPTILHAIRLRFNSTTRPVYLKTGFFVLFTVTLLDNITSMKVEVKNISNSAYSCIKVSLPLLSIQGCIINSSRLDVIPGIFIHVSFITIAFAFIAKQNDAQIFNQQKQTFRATITTNTRRICKRILKQ